MLILDSSFKSLCNMPKHEFFIVRVIEEFLEVVQIPLPGIVYNRFAHAYEPKEHVFVFLLHLLGLCPDAPYLD